MRHSAKAMIHFFDKQNVGISMRHDAGPEQSEFTELFFLSNFIIRHLSNLGRGPGTDQMELGFRAILAQHCDDFAVCPLEINVRPLDSKVATQQLTASLTFDFDAEMAQLSLDYAGFGFLQRHYPSYAPLACLSLLRHLCQQRADNLAYCRRAVIATVESARQFSTGQVTLSNHSRIALHVAISVNSIDVSWPRNGEILAPELGEVG